MRQHKQRSALDVQVSIDNINISAWTSLPRLCLELVCKVTHFFELSSKQKTFFFALILENVKGKICTLVVY